MNVVFYYPAVTPKTDFPTWEPLQILFLARMLRGKGIESRIIDGRIVSEESDLAQELSERVDQDTLCLGITSLTCFQMVNAQNALGKISELYPDLPVVFGGWHASLFPEEIIAMDAVDIVIRGQGENAFLEVVLRLASGKSPAGIPGIVWKGPEGPVHEAERKLESLDDMPRLSPADFKLLDLSRYQVKKVLFYMSSVGCPYACNYCCVGAGSRRRWIGLSAANVLLELESLQQAFGFKEMIFWDNVFFTNLKRVKQICEGLLEKNITVSWSAHGRINEVISWDEDFLALLQKSGCKSIFIGIESGSQSILDRLNKGIRAKDILPALEKLKKYGIGAAANYMVGLPGETRRDIRKTIDAIVRGLEIYEFDQTLFQVFIYRFLAFPGTEIYRSLDPELSAQLPTKAIDWAKYLHFKINDGMDPWEEEHTASGFAPATFYLWKGFLDRNPSVTLKRKIMKKLARARVRTGFYHIPIEWRMWKKSRTAG